MTSSSRTAGCDPSNFFYGVLVYTFLMYNKKHLQKQVCEEFFSMSLLSILKLWTLARMAMR
jgi:hypothetical protein